MKRHYRAFLFLTILLAGLMPSFPCFSQPSDRSGKEEKASSIVIKSDTLEMDDAKKRVSFVGKVDALKGTLRIKADRMTVHYTGRSTRETTEGEQAKIEKIVATGHVKIIRAEGGLATAEKAVYYQGEEKVVLTGKPVVKQGGDFVEGERVILFVNERRSIVEGSEGSRVRAVLSSGGEKR